MDQLKVGKFIAELRKSKKITQEELAEQLGINNRTISRWENGKNMPDISLYKPLCEILGISIEELINGEKTEKNDLKQSYEKAIINTIDSNNKVKKKMSKLIKLLLLIICIALITIISITIYYKNKYPKIDIYNMSVLTSDVNQLNTDLTLDMNNFKIYFYGIDSLQVSDSKNNYFDLKNALNYKQVTINDVKSYLESQYKNGNIKRYTLTDDGTKIYKSNKYDVIICNTKDGNNDIFFGTPDIESNLKGSYCGYKKNDTCQFTRTYHILNVTDDDDYNFINVTLKQFQGETSMVRINRYSNIKSGSNFEFTFSTYEMYEDNIVNIFNNSTLIEVRETSKLGLDQIQEKICVNPYE